MGFLEEFIEQEIDRGIQRLEGVTEGLDEIDRLPDHLWPDEKTVHGQFMFMLGSLTTSIEWLAVSVIEAHDLDPEDVDTSEARALAKAMLEGREDDIRQALKR